jgi:phosphoribosylformimino-5-aminoimidazole carboxamide ribotide isomerase
MLSKLTTRHPPSYYAELYRRNNLTGGHVIKLGPKNDEAAKEAVNTWPNSLQVGGGITLDNAQEWLDAGASKVCTSIHVEGAQELIIRLSSPAISFQMVNSLWTD